MGEKVFDGVIWKNFLPKVSFPEEMKVKKTLFSSETLESGKNDARRILFPKQLR